MMLVLEQPRFSSWSGSLRSPIFLHNVDPRPALFSFMTRVLEQPRFPSWCGSLSSLIFFHDADPRAAPFFFMARVLEQPYFSIWCRAFEGPVSSTRWQKTHLKSSDRMLQLECQNHHVSACMSKCRCVRANSDKKCESWNDPRLAQKGLCQEQSTRHAQIGSCFQSDNYNWHT